MTATTAPVRMPITHAAVLLFVVGEAALFGCLFFVYGGIRFGIGPAHAWDSGLSHALPLGEALMNTALLVSSSVAVWIAGRMLRSASAHGRLLAMLTLGTTILLGLCFLGLQGHEYHTLVHDGHGPSSSASASAFYSLTGVHGAHVAGGVLALMATFVRVLRSPASKESRTLLGAVSIYWHFVDLVWIVIVLTVYLPGR